MQETRNSSSPRGKGWLRNSGKAEEIKRKRSRWLKWTHSIWPRLNDWVALWSCPAAAWVPWMHHHQQVSEQRQVNSAQLNPVPRWIKGKNTDTPTCQKGEQVGKQREKKKNDGPLQFGWSNWNGMFFQFAVLQRWLGCGSQRVCCRPLMLSDQLK